MNYFCDDCHDTGWVGDNGPGRKGNNEYHECHCSYIPKSGKYPYEKVMEFLNLLKDDIFVSAAINIDSARLLEEITNAELPY